MDFVEPTLLSSHSILIAMSPSRYSVSINRATKDNPLTDADRFACVLMQAVGKRLTYAEVTGKEGETAPF